MTTTQKREKKRVPELRFPGFEGEWEVSKLKKVFSRSTKKNTNNITEVLTNSASQGIVSQGSYFDREIANPKSLKNYYVVEIDDFVYNPRISTLAPVGPLKRNNLYRGVMSPLYTVLNPIKGNLNFFEYFFESTCWHDYMKSVANYGARFDRMNVTIRDFENLPIKHPSLKEQQKIATFLTSIDRRIQLLEKKKTLLEQYKKGVMQRIFKQEVRFKDQDGKEFPKWEEKRLGDVAIKKSSNIAANKIEDNFGEYIIYGAPGILKRVDFYEEENDYISIVKDGAGVGRVLYCEGKSSVLATLDIIKPKKGLNTYFLYCLLQNINYLKYITGSTIPHIYFKDYKKEKIKVPTLPEQTKIAHFLSAIDKKIAAVDEQIAHTKEYKKGLLQRMFV